MTDTGVMDPDDNLDDDLLRRLRAEPVPAVAPDQPRPGRACEIARAFRYADRGQLAPIPVVVFCRRHQ